MSNKTSKLAELIQNCNSTKELELFLIGILSPQEIEIINKRIEVVKALKAGLPQREISEKLGVGIATVTRGSKMLKDGFFKNV